MIYGPMYCTNTDLFHWELMLLLLLDRTTPFVSITSAIILILNMNYLYYTAIISSSINALNHFSS